jgi:hypothetical protein
VASAIFYRTSSLINHSNKYFFLDSLSSSSACLAFVFDFSPSHFSHFFGMNVETHFDLLFGHIRVNQTEAGRREGNDGVTREKKNEMNASCTSKTAFSLFHCPRDVSCLREGPSACKQALGRGDVNALLPSALLRRVEKIL